MLTGSIGETHAVVYGDLPNLREKLSQELASIVPKLNARRKTYGNHDGTALGKRLRDLRERSGLSVGSLAQQAGISEGELGVIESQPEQVSLPTLDKIRQQNHSIPPDSSFVGSPAPQTTLKNIQNQYPTRSLTVPHLLQISHIIIYITSHIHLQPHLFRHHHLPEDITSKHAPDSYSGMTFAAADLGFGAGNFYSIHHTPAMSTISLIVPSR